MRLNIVVPTPLPGRCIFPTCTPPVGQSHCCTDGYGTQLPQGTGVAATFNVELVFDAGVVASTESRAMQNHFPHRKVADYRTGCGQSTSTVTCTAVLTRG